MKQSQIDIVKRELQEKGYITRNWCLKNYISRLGAIVHRLKEDGMLIEGRYEKYEYGKDFVYYLGSRATQVDKVIAEANAVEAKKIERCRDCAKFQCGCNKAQATLV